MNSISCNQASFLQDHFNDYGFFEAGRSGVTFFEALEISKYLDTKINPSYHLIYLGNGDFNESITSKGRYTDRVQIDLSKEVILNARLKSPLAKRILYSSKLLYYFYLRFPIFVSKQNKGIIEKKSKQNKSKFDEQKLEQLFSFCSEKYNLNKIILVFHPNIEKIIVKLSKSYEFNTLELNSEPNDSWGLGKHDGHWSCYGHNKAAAQVKKIIKNRSLLNYKEKNEL